MFTALLRASLANRIFVLVTAVVLMLYGALAVRQTPVDVFPDLNRPTVTLMTEAGGMAPEEVELSITFPLETAMNGLPGISVVRSVSSAGLSFVYLTFDWNVEIYRARQLVSERLQTVRDQLPATVNPVMGPVSSVMGEILQIAIPIDPAKISPMATREFADFVLRPRLLTIPGIAQVIPIGGEVRQYQVQPLPARMAELNVTLQQIREAVASFSTNTSGGFLELNGREYLIRNIGRTNRLADLQSTPVAVVRGQPILLSQVAEVRFAAAIKRGDAGFNGGPAVMLGVQKQPTADTLKLTRDVEAALVGLSKTLPEGMSAPRVTFRQATFIESSVNNLTSKLMTASVIVLVILYLFLANVRTTVISLVAIPLSMLITALVFKGLGLSINTMTLGGLAIAIGELVDDAVVGVENILRRLKLNRSASNPASSLQIILQASIEVRSAVLYATIIICLVFVPLFVLPGIEGRLFIPLGVAYITSILASLLVAVTVTPVMAYYLLPGMKSLDHGDSRFLAWLKRRYAPALASVLRRPKVWVAGALLSVAAAGISVAWFPTTFLPPFNEGSILVGLRLNPGTTLAESVRVAQTAERLVQAVPEVVHVGRRSGRAELDEHAEGVHVSELDLKLRRSNRTTEEVYADIRTKLAPLPAAINLGQPISHRIDHMLSGVRAQIAIRIVGDDLDTLRAEAERLREQLSRIPGIADLEVEKQVLTPQIKVRLDYDRVAQFGVSASEVLNELQMAVDGAVITQVVEGNRRFNLVMRLPEGQRATEGLKGLLVDTPTGPVPLSSLASIDESDGPNQISRDDGRRRIVLSANAQGRPLSDVVTDLRAATAAFKPPEGYFITLGGQFQAQEEAARLISVLSIVSAVLIFVVLYSRYQSGVLALLIMANVPLALVGAVIGLWLSGQPLSIAALIGFITLAGIAVRNGILKVSHYVNLCKFEGESFSDSMLIRGSIERLAPVLMTALVAAGALSALLFEAGEPGTEVLYPVAVVIFSGLVSSTLLDTFITPALVKLFGEPGVRHLMQASGSETL
jgi:heavy-metal exporter, HME family